MARTFLPLAMALFLGCAGGESDASSAPPARPAPPTAGAARDASAPPGSTPADDAGGDAAGETGDAAALSDAGRCLVDRDCNHGASGTGIICATTGPQGGECIAGCHADADCAAGERCDTAASPHWACVAVDAGTSGCPVLAYPSGIHVQTRADPATTASYTNHLAAGETAPECFVDADHLDDPTTGQTYALTTKISASYSFDDLVGTEIAQGFGHFVLLAPAAVVSLEAFRSLVGTSVSVNSGFRSPKHQESVCAGLCGNPLGCPGTCANNSRHMWGDAFDLPLEFYTQTDEDRACTAGFHFAYLESGTHLHVDQNPAYTTCVEQ